MPTIGHVDSVTNERAVGWAVGSGGLVIEAWIDGRCVAQCVPDRMRGDIATAHPGYALARTSGFSLEIPADVVRSDKIFELSVTARSSEPTIPPVPLGTFQIAGAGLLSSLNDLPLSNLLSPFPQNITDIIAARWPQDCADLASTAGQLRFVERLKQLMDMPGVNSLPAIADYARYLATTLAHCRFVEGHFPTSNERAQATAEDVNCKPNSVHELFPIIHQLYVLRSHGLRGDFAEFGCFKGYSSSMLSFACQQLGVTMHIFDSFEGLPPAEGSGYEPGQFAGSLEEVRENVGRFGAIGSVEFHKGFFSDTFRNWRPPSLMCMWMDVDLEVSSRDLMVVADRLDPAGTVFSHETSADIFGDDTIVSPPQPSNPIRPMLDRFNELGRPLTGHYVSGHTGAFWARRGGIPVIATDALFDLVSRYDPV